jgi:hypothetical protein
MTTETILRFGEGAESEDAFMRIDKNFLIAVVLVMAAACHAPTELERATSDLAASRQRWAAQGLSTYQFTFDKNCFCDVRGPVRVSVKDGVVVGAMRIATGEVVDTRNIPTVDSLFAFVERGISSRSDVLRVTYDPLCGFPTEIYSDGSYQIADDEITYTTKDLVPQR